MFDFNDAEKQRSNMIPDGTIVPVHMTIRPGGSGDGGWLKRNRDGNCLMLDCEFTVTEGEYARRKFWALLTVQGETEGQIKAVEITRSRLRAMLESARGINPADESQDATSARRVNSYQDFDGIRFWAVAGYEPAKGEYKEKNTFKAVITPDKKDWSKLDQANSRSAGGGAPAPRATTAQPPKAAGSRPSWAA